MRKFMRQIILDTETTGFNSDADRIIELAMVEILDGQETGKIRHYYFYPQMVISEDAIEITGITNKFLSDKPTFCEKAQDILNFIDGAVIVAHNIQFDLDFICMEMELCGFVFDDYYQSKIDTLKLARAKYPGKRCSLDALIEKLSLDYSDLDDSGALLGAKLLARVYPHLDC